MISRRALGPALAVAVAVVGAGALARGEAREPTRPPTAAVAAVAAVAVTSDAPRAEDLAELVATADLVVRAEVTTTARGRLFGAPGAGAIESRLVALQVAEVLAGAAPADATLVVEEEGWLEDGTPIAVDGAPPSAEGDDGIWFLQAVGTAEAPLHVVVGAQGRYLLDGERLQGAAGDDPLIARLSAMSPDELARAVAATPSR